MPTSRDYARYAKGGFLLGLSLFLLGAAGEFLLAPVPGTPAWETALFFDMEAAGVVIGLFAPLVFGMILPLTE